MANYYSYDEKDASYGYNYNYNYNYNYSYSYGYYGYSAGSYDAPGYVNSSYYLGTGEAAYGYISSSSDKDYYSLGYLSSGSYQYTIQASGTSWASNTSNGQYNTPDVSIYDASGNLVKSGSAGSVTFSPGASDYYYVAVSDSSASQYKLTLVETYKSNYYAPSVSGSSVSLNEKSAAGTSVHDVYASDSDGDSITYAIYSGNTDVDGDGNAAFSIRSSDGLITVNDADDLNYKTQSSFSLSVRASDGSKTGSGTVVVNLVDVNDAPTGSVTIGGTATQGQSLTASHTLADLDNLGTISYQWEANGTAITGATSSTYTLNQAEVGKAITVTLSYIDGLGTAEAVTSTATSLVANVNDALTGSVTLSGTAIEGKVLKVVSTLEDLDGPGVAEVQWLSDGSAISGAIQDSYTLTKSDVGKSISARLSYTDGGGFTESKTTAAVLAEALNPEVIITGDDKETGEDGSTAVFSIKLAKAPVNPVTIQFALSDTSEAKLGTSSLTFTQANWNIAQSLTVTGLDDYDNDKNVGYNLTAKVDTTDLSYKRVTVNSIGLTNNDDTEDAPFQKYGKDEIDYIQGKNGADRLYGRGDMDDIRGGRGDDRVYGQEDDDELYGEDGNDWVYGGYDDDLVDGGNGNDKLYGEEGDDTLKGGAGNDILNGGEGADLMVGGAGNDTYYVDDAGDVIDDQGASTDEDTVIVMSTITYTLGANIEKAEIQDGSGEASLTGNALSNELSGNDNKNQLDGGTGADTLDGGAGNDTLLGGEGTDSLVGGLGNDILNGGTGDDLADFSDAAAGFVSVNLATGKAKGDGADTLISIEDVIGSEGDDTIVGSTADNELTGGLGDDSLGGGGGSDVLYAGTGDDTVDGGDGDDLIVGGDGAGDDNYIGGLGSDTIKYTSATAAITVDLVKGNATSTAGNDAAKIGSDTLSGIENVIAGNYNDTITGNDSANVLSGQNGNDVLKGGFGKDTLDGGAGTDTADYSDKTTAVAVTLNGATAVNVNIGGVVEDSLKNIENLTGGSAADTLNGDGLANTLLGNAGNDILKGGKGADVLTGGTGKDTFVFAAGDSGQTTGFDQIKDYAKGVVGTGDLIDYSASLSKGGVATAAAADRASINATTGVATFASGSGTTMADALVDVAKSLSLDAVKDVAGEFAFFKVNRVGDYYLFVSDGTAGVTANDMVVQLVGVTSIGGIDLTGGNLTLTS
ncbi:cadherin domain-containing protein [Malikia sp.]|uniref:cadherin domain-containing protein n=1 Tax=Malikia sp. TaxID=2070706 RepID=UPI00263939E8|nr:cadherin domain-containing protein [Malikia sp.]MDD2727815.1 cadherin domain-containing protein [Malikia sp.]